MKYYYSAPSNTVLRVWGRASFMLLSVFSIAWISLFWASIDNLPQKPAPRNILCLEYEAITEENGWIKFQGPTVLFPHSFFVAMVFFRPAAVASRPRCKFISHCAGLICDAQCTSTKLLECCWSHDTPPTPMQQNKANIVTLSKLQRAKGELLDDLTVKVINFTNDQNISLHREHTQAQLNLVVVLIVCCYCCGKAQWTTYAKLKGHCSLELSNRNSTFRWLDSLCWDQLDKWREEVMLSSLTLG